MVTLWSNPKSYLLKTFSILFSFIILRRLEEFLRYHTLTMTLPKKRISNTELLERNDMSYIRLTIKQRKWRWLGYNMRRRDDINIANQFLK